MMTKSPSSTLALGKYLLFIPLAFLVLMACEDAETQKEISDAIVEVPDEAKFFEQIDTLVTFDPLTSKEDVAIVQTTIYETADQMPVFGACDGYEGNELMSCSNKNLLTYIYENVEYPKEASAAGLEGMALIKFIVDTQGKVTGVQLIKEKTTEHLALNQAALATVNSLPDFRPGQYQGKAVNVQMVIPIKFKLD